MHPYDIIAKDAVKHGLDPKVTNASIQTMIAKKIAMLMVSNETVFLLIHMGEGKFATRIISQDSPLKFIESLKKFVARVRKVDGIKALYGNNEEKGIIQALKKTGLKVNNANKKGYNWEVNIRKGSL